MRWTPESYQPPFVPLLTHFQATETDARGGFAVRDHRGEGIFLVKAVGYARRVILPGQRGAFWVSGSLEIALDPEARLEVGSGAVRADQVEPSGYWLEREPREFPDAGITLHEPMEGPEDLGDGQWGWGALAPGAYRLRALYRDPDADSQLSIERRVELGAGEHKVLDFAEGLGTHTIRGRFVDQQGEPLMSVSATLRPLFDSPLAQFSVSIPNTTTLARFWIGYLPAGRYELEVRSYLLHPRGVEAPTTTIEITGDLERDFVIDTAEPDSVGGEAP